MEKIKDKLNYFEKNLSVKHLGRDIIGIQVLLFVSAIVAGLLFILVVNTAVGSNDPEKVITTAKETSNFLKWFLWIGMNVAIMFVSSKAKKEAAKTKQEIEAMFEAKEVKE